MSKLADVLDYGKRFSEPETELYLTQTGIKNFRACPISWLAYAYGWREKLYRIPLQFGSAVDAGVLEPEVNPSLDGAKIFHEKFSDMDPVDRDGAPLIYDAGDVKGKNSRVNLGVAGENRCNEYRDEMAVLTQAGTREVVNVHTEFWKVDPVHPESGKLDDVMQNVIFCGTRDLFERVYVPEDSDMVDVLTDVKTGKAWGYEEGQLRIYQLGHMYETGEYIPVTSNIFLSKSMKSKNPVHRVFYRSQDLSIMIDTYRKVKNAAADIRSQEFYREPTACITWGRLCAYHPICFPDAHTDAARKIKDELINYRADYYAQFVKKNETEA